MQRTSFGEMTCSIARALDVIGEPWSPLVLRNVYVGISRFDQMRDQLGIFAQGAHRTPETSDDPPGCWYGGLVLTGPRGSSTP